MSKVKVLPPSEESLEEAWKVTPINRLQSKIFLTSKLSIPSTEPRMIKFVQSEFEKSHSILLDFTKRGLTMASVPYLLGFFRKYKDVICQSEKHYVSLDTKNLIEDVAGHKGFLGIISDGDLKRIHVTLDKVTDSFYGYWFPVFID